MTKKTKLLLFFIIGMILGSIAITYYKTIVLNDYKIVELEVRE